jgi:two-component sensor histidine kinase
MSDERIFRRPENVSAELERRHFELLTDAEFTRSVLANSTEAIQVLDLDARIEFMSVGALEAMEIDDPGAIIATSWLALWGAETQMRAIAAIEDAKAGKTSVCEGTRLTASGKPSWWEITVSPILGAQGQTARLLAISRNVTDRKLAQQSQQMLMQELHHRVRNMLTMVMAITSQSLARATSIADGRLAVERRLMALAEAHSLLRDGAADEASLRMVVSGAVQPYDSEPSRFALDGDDVRLSSPAALAIAMAIHELCTNAVKYGALSAETGSVAIVWGIAGARRFHLTWREHGGPPVEKPTRRGFGMRVIEASFRDQLGGRVDMSFEPAGFTCAVDAPLDALRAPAAKTTP